MSLDRGRRGRGPERVVPNPSSETQRDRYTGFCLPPEDGSARLSEGVGAMSGVVSTIARPWPGVQGDLVLLTF